MFQIERGPNLRFKPTLISKKNTSLLVHLYGTPRVDENGTEFELQVRIYKNGHAERAHWTRFEKKSKEAIVPEIFVHRDINLAEKNVAAITKALEGLTDYPHTDPEEFSNDYIRIIKYEDAGNSSRTVCILDPLEQLPSPIVTEKESASFWKVWNLVEELTNEETRQG